MRLQLLVGPIASGKSTFCREAAQDGKIILNDDSIVNALHGGDYSLYSKELKPLYKSVENQIVQTSLTLGKVVVVDRPNHSRQMRRRYIGLAKSLDCLVDLVMFKRELPEVHAKRRFESDSRGHTFEYWLKAAQCHQNLYEEPHESEGFDSIIHWEFPSG
jgi:predicted kinase